MVDLEVRDPFSCPKCGECPVRVLSEGHFRPKFENGRYVGKEFASMSWTYTCGNGHEWKRTSELKD